MKLKQKIHQMVPQPIVRPWLALAIFLLCALLVFILSSFIQSELFIDLQNTPVLHILFSLCVPLTLFYDRGINLKFPFFIQKYLIDPQLAQDIAEQKLLNTHKQLFWPNVLFVQNAGRSNSHNYYYSYQITIKAYGLR